MRRCARGTPAPSPGASTRGAPVRTHGPAPRTRSHESGIGRHSQPTNPHRTCQVQIVFLLLLLRSLLLRALLLSTLLLGHGRITSPFYSTGCGGSCGLHLDPSRSRILAAEYVPPRSSRVPHGVLHARPSTMRATIGRASAIASVSHCDGANCLEHLIRVRTRARCGERCGYTG